MTRQFGGLGLGLTITKGLVEMHGGSISAYSDGQGKGATFRVRPLPHRRRTILRHAQGHRGEIAADVATALALAETAHHFDLLISDLGLPDGSALDLVRELRSRSNAIPGIAISGYGQDEDIRRSRASGFAEHLTKPSNYGGSVQRAGQ
ncbi:MAG: response regulator [Bacillota bacterium]